MTEYRVLQTIILGYIDPRDDEQHDLLVHPSDGINIGFDGRIIFFRRRGGPWVPSITVNYAIEAWVADGTIKALE